MKQQNLRQTVFLLGVFLLFGGFAVAQQTWEVPYDDYPNGNKRIVQIRQGKKVKKSTVIGYKMFYKTGELRAEISRENDKLYHWKEYYKNGQLGAIGDSKMDIIKIRAGQWKTYHKNGQLKQTLFLNGSFKSGDYKEYHDNGVLKVTGQFTELGAYQGTWTYYDENGEVEEIKDFGEKTYIIKESKPWDNGADYLEDFNLL